MAGWVAVDDLLGAAQTSFPGVGLADLQAMVRDSDKQRFAFSADGTRIRANQGHSVPVELGLPPSAPPDVLYHGTATKNCASIMAGGLLPGRRQHVHLSADAQTALAVGQRHGRPVVYAVDAAAMFRDGVVFYVSVNGVWLTERVPTKYLRLEGG